MKTDKDKIMCSHDGQVSMQLGCIANELLRNGKVEVQGDTVKVTCDRFVVEYNVEDIKDE